MSPLSKDHSMLTREALEHTLGFQVSDFERYRQAFVHKSRATAELQSYERLEFIGDAVINLLVARWLYEWFPHEQEGFLTRLRTKLVSGKCLSRLAQGLQLHRFVQMNDRALSAGWQHNPRIQEDVMEALVGIIYLVEGLVVARQFLLTLYHQSINFDELMGEENYKDVLMRWTQAEGFPLPEYTVVSVHPPDGARFIKATFEISVTVNRCTGRGLGPTKKIAQQEAARQTLLRLGVPTNY